MIPFAVWSLTRLMTSLRIQVVYVNDYWWGPVACLACRFAKIPCVVYIRQEIQPKRIRQYQLDKPQKLIAISEQIKRVAIEAGVSPDRIVMIYSGIKPNASIRLSDREKVKTQYGISPGQPVIGTVANLFPRKGYEYMIEALEFLRAEAGSVRYLLVGQGDPIYRNKLAKMIQERGLTNNVVFCGFHDPVYDHIAAMDVFVLPSVMEGFGIALLEAMVMGKPVVATAVGGISEVVEDGVTGFLVPPKDPSALSVKILSILQNPTLARKMGEAGLSRVNARFSLDQTLSQIQSLTEELARPDSV